VIDCTVTPDGGEPVAVTILSRDVLTWERTGRGRSFGALMDDISMTAMYHLAWIAMRRLGHFAGDLTEFEQTCEVSLETDQEDEAGPDPTQPAPSVATLSRLPSRPGSPRASGGRKVSAS